MEKSKQIELQLSVEEVNTVLEAMGQLPFIRVYTVIEKIQTQAAQQLNGKLNTEPETKEKTPQP